MEPPSAVGVDEVSLYDQVLQHVLRLVLAAQHQPSEAVVDGQRLRDEQTSMTGPPSNWRTNPKTLLATAIDQFNSNAFY